MKQHLKKYYNDFLLIFCILILSSCRLDGDTLVEGKLIDEYSGRPVPNAWVGVYGSNPSKNNSIIGMGSSSLYTLMAEGKTNASGEFGFQFDGKLKSPYKMAAGLEPNAHSLSLTEETEIKRRRNNKDLLIKFKKPLPAVIHMLDTGAQTSTIIKYGNYTPDPQITLLNVKDTVIYRTIAPFTNPFSEYYYIRNLTAGTPEERKKIDIHLPIPDDTIRINIHF